MLTAADNWFLYNFRVHCRDLIQHRLLDIDVANQFSEETSACSDMRKLVLELCQPIFSTRRIINMDNLYGSAQLFEQLYVKGLYARGTARMNRRHAPQHLTFTKRDLKVYPRGSFRFGVCAEGVNRPIVFASWIDGSVVNIMSNVDSTELSEVTRTYGATTKTYEAPQIIHEYNAYMQGVDRLDQLRARFSIAERHSFKKYYKKLALGIIDLARVNAYKARSYVQSASNQDSSCRRDPHRTFMIELSSQLITGEWKKTPSSNILDDFSDDGESSSTSNSNCAASSIPDYAIYVGKCVTTEYSIDEKRRKRQCIVCRWENRIISVQTLHDHTHNVSLCMKSRSEYDRKPYMCPNTGWTCWKKYHEFYYPRKLYNIRGNICSSNELYRLRRQVEGDSAILKY